MARNPKLIILNKFMVFGRRDRYLILFSEKEYCYGAFGPSPFLIVVKNGPAEPQKTNTYFSGIRASGLELELADAGVGIGIGWGKGIPLIANKNKIRMFKFT